LFFSIVHLLLTGEQYVPRFFNSTGRWLILTRQRNHPPGRIGENYNYFRIGLECLSRVVLPVTAVCAFFDALTDGNMTILIIGIFILAYLGIALEEFIKINKTAFALLAGVLTWTVYMLYTPDKELVGEQLMEKIGGF
jgi:hypothetical protein